VITLTTFRRVHSASPSFSILVLVGALAIGACGGGDAAPAETAAAEEHAGEEGVVVLDTAAIRLGGIQVGEVQSVTTTALAVTGSITFDADRVSHVGSRSNGRIVAVRSDLGAQVARGQALATLESVEVGQIRAEEREAEALLKIAQENYAREQRLAEQGISSRKELLEAEAMLRRAEAALHSAEDRLQVLGASHDHGAGGEFTLVAPFAGVVVARDASLGEMATPADTLFTVADLSEVWIELDIFERDLARVRRGQSVAVLVSAYPSRSFPGRIVYVGDVLDPAKRTVRARVEIPNRDAALKPGMFATANIQVGGGGPPMAVVPQDAVQTVEGKLVVFVPGDTPGEFRTVPVEVGPTTDGNRIVILSGIAPGSRVVTVGAFALRSELSKGEIGEDGH
jgi:cobalt-zinc-cadmium efflux system membrane fusion protein